MKTTQGRALRALTSTLVLAMLAALLLAGTALAAARPGVPTAKAPRSTIATTKPTVSWGRAPRAARYELRVYKGKQLQIKKTRLKKTTWTSTEALPTNVDLTWNVRASNARGVGAWSRRLGFRIAALAIGDVYGGGKVAYILQPGDPGYVAGQTHGLIAAAADQTSDDSGIQWAIEQYWHISVPGALGTAIGSGAANTDAIIAQNGGGTDYAAGLARAYAGGGYSDWYLPSYDEVKQLHRNYAAIGGFDLERRPYYWSSTQSDASPSGAWYQDFNWGFQIDHYDKEDPNRVRAIRAF